MSARTTTTRLATALAVTTLGLAAGCSGPSLEDSDPKGFQACTDFAQAMAIEDNPVQQTISLIDVGDEASTAKIDAIRAAAEPIADQFLVNVENMRTACTSAGVDVPEA